MRSPDSTVDFGLKWLVAHLCSYAYGCQYCSAHTLKNGETAGLSREKLDAIWDYERSALFSEAERAAFLVAQGAATSPPSVSDNDMENLRKHFSHEQVVEIIAVVSYFGFLNRWNDIMATQLEETVLDFTDEIGLRSKGWNPERHVAK
jgi:alkylhydroperoxidase family enzyme